jgi:hypothetical protein
LGLVHGEGFQEEVGLRKSHSVFVSVQEVDLLKVEVGDLVGSEVVDQKLILFVGESVGVETDSAVLYEEVGQLLVEIDGQWVVVKLERCLPLEDITLGKELGSVNGEFFSLN